MMTRAAWLFLATGIAFASSPACIGDAPPVAMRDGGTVTDGPAGTGGSGASTGRDGGDADGTGGAGTGLPGSGGQTGAVGTGGASVAPGSGGSGGGSVTGTGGGSSGGAPAGSGGRGSGGSGSGGRGSGGSGSGGAGTGGSGSGGSGTGGRMGPGGSGTGGSPGSGGTPGTGGAGGRPVTCTGTGVSASCSDGYNCSAGTCVPASISCAGQKSSHPSSGDGVYWIGPPMMRAYCDMKVPIELCTEVMQEHSGGRTRDGSNLTFALKSVLLWSQGECAIWALRSLPTGLPFSAYAQAHSLSTCQAFGFMGDGQLGNCKYGDHPGFGGCGFGAAPFYVYGDKCAGCTVGNGPHDSYTRQGEIHESTVLTSFDPSTQTRCKVK